MTRRFLFAVILAASAGAQPRPMTADDYLKFEFAADPRLSPDGKLVAYVLTAIDEKQNRRNSSIWMAAADDSRAPWQFTTSPQSSRAPRWKPDGSGLAFLSSRDGAAAGAQVYLLSMQGGEARKITSLRNGVSGFVWSPDGKRLACLGRSGPSDTRPSSSDVRHYLHLTYKFNDTGWYDGKRSHIWIVDAATGAAKQLTSGDAWDDTDPQWSPDSSKIAFVSDRTGKALEESRNTDVWVTGADGGALTKISTHPESDRSPRWSPDGKWIAYTGAIEDGGHARIWIAPSSGGESRLAAKNADLLAADLDWAEEGRALYFQAGTRGESHLFRIDVAAGGVKPVTGGPRTVRAMDIHDASRTMTYTVNDPLHLDDVYVSSLTGAGERRLTSLNRGLWDKVRLASVERVPYKAADGWEIDGFLMRPVGWREGRSYPLVLSIHGGPAGMYGMDFFHEFQVYAGRGWAVFFTNPRGSTGYGEKFQRAVAGEWGGKAYTDIMSGLDAVTKKYSWIDQNRMGVTGGSYGGFMTNWIVSHTDRFKAAVTLRSISNFVSDEGTRDGAYGHTRDFGGDLFQAFDTYWNTSPLKYVKNVKTPTLVLHSDNDYRVPLEQGEQWFRALRHYGVTSEFVIFPRENHNLTRTGEPKHLVESIQWQVYWFDRFLNGNAAAVRPNEVTPAK